MQERQNSGGVTKRRNKYNVFFPASQMPDVFSSTETLTFLFPFVSLHWFQCMVTCILLGFEDICKSKETVLAYSFWLCFWISGGEEWSDAVNQVWVFWRVSEFQNMLCMLLMIFISNFAVCSVQMQMRNCWRNSWKMRKWWFYV